MNLIDFQSDGWQKIANASGWSELDDLLLGGEDGVIKEVQFSSGEFVDVNLNMNYMNAPRIWMLVQSQNENVPTVEFLFDNVYEVTILPNYELALSTTFNEERVTLFFSGSDKMDAVPSVPKIVCSSMFYRIPQTPLLGPGGFSYF